MKGTLPRAAAFFALMISIGDAQTVVSPSAQSCLSCHNTRADAGALPSLANQDSSTIANMMAEFRSGQRHGTIMNRIAKGYSDADIKALADEIARVTGGGNP
jgi:sulfide dehydrogenase cytochrome subunit